MNIPALIESNEENIVMAKKLKAKTEEAKANTSKRSKRSLNTQNHKSKINEVTEEQKANYEKKFKEIKERFLAKQKNKNNTPVVSSKNMTKTTTKTTRNLWFLSHQRNQQHRLHILKQRHSKIYAYS